MTLKFALSIVQLTGSLVLSTVALAHPPQQHRLRELFTLNTSTFDLIDTNNGSTLDPSSIATFKCKEECTLISDTVVHVESVTDNNQIAICPEVDGVKTTGSCLVLVAPKATFEFTDVPVMTYATLSPGQHTVQVFLYSQGQASWVERQNIYRVYKVIKSNDSVPPG